MQTESYEPRSGGKKKSLSAKPTKPVRLTNSRAAFRGERGFMVVMKNFI